MTRSAKTEEAVVAGEVHKNLSLTVTESLTLKFLSSLGTLLAFTIALTSVTLDNVYAQNEEFTSDPDEIEALYQEGNYQEALDAWMVKAFEGEAEAQFKVGTMFREGQGITPDPEQSVYWYLQAARQNHIAAQYNLGHAFMSGLGAEKDEPEAVRWWTAAAEAGEELAQFNVGRAYYMGIGATKDENEAKRWFVAAAAQGEPRSQALVNRLGWNTAETNLAAAPSAPDSTATSITTEPITEQVATTATPAQTPTPEPIPVEDPTPEIAAEPEPALEPTPSVSVDPVSEPMPTPPPAAVAEPTPADQTQVATAEPVAIDKPIANSQAKPAQNIAQPEITNVQLDDETTIPAHLAVKATTASTADQENSTAADIEPELDMPAASAAPTSTSRALVDDQINNSDAAPRSQQTNSQPLINPLLPARRPTAITDGPSDAVARAASARRAEQSRISTQAANSTNVSQATNAMAVATSSSSTRSANRSIDTFTIDRAMVIYQDSNTHSNTLGILPTSERVDVIEKNGHWLKIRRRTGIPMWVSSRYLRTTTTDAGRITGDSVNVRATPTINDANKLGSLQNGEMVGVQCAGRDWSFITSPSDFTGWILADQSGAPAPIATSDCPAIPSNQSPFSNPATRLATASAPAAKLPTEFNVTPDDNWLFAQQPGNFTIQLAKFQTPAGLTQYIAQNQLTGDSLLKQFTQTSIGETQAYLLYGSYRTQTEALQKARELGAVNPWVRNISVVRENRCRRWNIQRTSDTPASRFCT